MTRTRVDRALRWLGAWLLAQGVVAAAGWLVSLRTDEGDDSTAGIRRLRVMGGVDLRPHHPRLSRVRLDLLMAGGELDLTGVPRVPGGVDVTAHVVMAGLEITVPHDWRVWVEGGGVDVDRRLPRAGEERFADLRLHARVVLGGLALEAGEPAVGVAR